MVTPRQKPRALLYGLSADPVHCGHTRLLKTACEQLAARQQCPSRVLIMPVGRINPVGQKKAASTGFHHRFRLCQLAFEPLSLPCPLQILDSEWQAIRSGGQHNTTWDTLHSLHQTVLWKEELIVLLSADHFSAESQQQTPAFFRWHRWQELLGKADWLIAERCGYPLASPVKKKLAMVIADQGRTLEWLRWQSPDISSTRLRQWLAAGPAGIKKAEPFLSETVSAYLQAHDLYGPDLSD